MQLLIVFRILHTAKGIIAGSQTCVENEILWTTNSIIFPFSANQQPFLRVLCAMPMLILVAFFTITRISTIILEFSECRNNQFFKSITCIQFSIEFPRSFCHDEAQGGFASFFCRILQFFFQRSLNFHFASFMHRRSFFFISFSLH